MEFDGEKIYIFLRELNKNGNPRQYGEPPMKLKDLARLTNLSYRSLWRIANTGIKNGVRKTPPNINQVIKIAMVLKKEINDFIGGEDGREKNR